MSLLNSPGPTLGLRIQDLSWLARRWLEQPWCAQNPPVFQSLCRLLALVDMSNQYYLNVGDQLFVHLQHEIDSDGNRLPLRKVDCLGGLAKWHWLVTTHYKEEVRYHYWAVKMAMIEQEVQNGIHRGMDSVTAYISRDPDWVSFYPRYELD